VRIIHALDEIEEAIDNAPGAPGVASDLNFYDAVGR